ncbi:hypothetical protein HID58_043390 [Brassica napus]|uniref:F-box domain-containing protein n=1 Tax=Brassica napus TaxID=3708 RepID=A0ABQ8BGD4_BRANA|nr:hypothetical protein HID58_043390 [Brassica napus]
MHWRSLPGDLVEDILSRVSAIPLVRLRETSKQWNAKLKSGSFAKMHAAHAPKEESLMITLIDHRKSTYVTFFTAMAYCYAPQRTRDSWFGIHVQGKPNEQNQVVVFLNTKNILHVMRQNKHSLEKHLGGKSSVLLNYVPSLAQIQEATLPGGRKRKAPST